MARIKKYKIGKRLGAGVYEKCQTQKFIISQGRSVKTGRRPKRPSDYGLQLLDKQRVRFMYNVREKQFSNYVKEATEKARTGVSPADVLFRSLESRLDNVVYRMGFAPTRLMARQLTSHGHFTVNGKRTTAPSYRVKEGDVIAVRDGSKNRPVFLALQADKLEKRATQPWVSFDLSKLEGKVTGTPSEPDQFLNFHSVVNFYSR